MKAAVLSLLSLLLILPVPSQQIGETERLYPYGGPTAREISTLGNPYERGELAALIDQVYSRQETCRPWLSLMEDGLSYQGKIIPWRKPATAPRTWRSPSELPPVTDAMKPLSGMRIAIDPGHLGGEWSAMEQRDNVISNKFRVCEGVSTQIVATLLARSLRELGADVMMTRKGSQPATNLRLGDLAKALAKQKGRPVNEAIVKEAEHLFLRRVEINARAGLLRKYKPDLTICLHFDAGNVSAPVDRLHFIINGACTPAEIEDEDLRTALMSRILSQVHKEDLAIAKTVAQTMAEKLKLPAHTYYVPAENVREVPGQPYLWYRNLLANCLYPGPVLYAEPYAMNNELTARRMTLGDYEGTRNFNGVPYRSIYREYAESLTEGIREYYSRTRKKSLSR